MNGEKKRVGVRVDPSTWSVAEWKKVATVYTTADRLICNTPCFLLSVLATGYDDDNGEIKIYDGQGAIGNPKYHVRTAARVSFFLDFSVPVYFAQGMYLDIVDKCDAVTIQYLPWNP